MYFNLDPSIDINNFSINDSVSFDLIVNNESSYTINYKKLGQANILIDDFWESDDNKYE